MREVQAGVQTDRRLAAWETFEVASLPEREAEAKYLHDPSHVAKVRWSTVRGTGPPNARNELKRHMSLSPSRRVKRERAIERLSSLRGRLFSLRVRKKKRPLH